MERIEVSERALRGRIKTKLKAEGMHLHVSAPDSKETNNLRGRYQVVNDKNVIVDVFESLEAMAERYNVLAPGEALATV